MRWKYLVLVGLLLAGVATGLGCAWPFGQRAEVLRLPGIVEVHEVLLGPRVAGRVKEVHVTESDLLSEGMPLVTLEVPELEAQREVLKAKVQEAEAELRKAENGPRQQEKDAAAAAAGVARAKLMKMEKGFRDEEKRQAKSELESAQADEQQARQEYQRELRLMRQGAARRQDYDAAQAALERAQARLRMAQARQDMYQAGMRDEEVLEARAELKRLEAQQALLEAGTREEDKSSARARLAEAKARLEEVEVNIREAVVRSAEPCVVEVVHVRKGSLVQAGTPVAKVLRAADLWVKTYVPETQLGKLRLGQEVQVTMDSYPDVRFAGRVTLIGAESEFTPRNVQTVDERRHQMFGVRVKIDDPQGRFKSGMAAEVYIPVADGPRTK
jgi:multidrug resistance efflux pump